MPAPPRPPEPRPSGVGAAIAAATRRSRRSLLRHHGGGHAKVSFLELFFDLVYVFAITQLSHTLLEHLSWQGLAEGAVLFFAVWWAWMYTTWAVNWADPDRLEVRLMLIAVMLASLAMAVAMPQAFTTGAWPFAVSYVLIQLGRTLFMAWAMGREERAGARNMLRIAAWFAASAVLWFAGAAGGEDLRFGWWFAALSLEYLGPVAGFRTPFLGQSHAADWNISGSHMAERCALFIIIALGEGIIVTGSQFASSAIDTPRTMAAGVAFLTSALMWWVYFDIGAERGAAHIRGHAEPGRIARNAYTYWHMPIVAGIVVSAVSDALLLAEPDAPASAGLVVTMFGGLAAYLAGTGFFKRFNSAIGNFPLSHGAGLILTAAAAAWSWLTHPRALQTGAAVVAILLTVAVWEWVSFHGGWRERFNHLARRWR